MKLSQIFWQTIKEDPSDAEISSHKLLIRAGLISKSAAGIYNYLPFATKVIRKIENIIREELENIQSQEIVMSVMTPGDLWKETGRWDKMTGEMLKVQDKSGRDLCFSPTNEEAVVDIFRKFVTSYKALPVSLFQINTKFRDEIRPRFGLMRGREFSMKDAYSFHANMQCLDETYSKFYNAYSNIFKRMGLEFIIVEADGGAIAGGDKKTHEFQVLAKTGEDRVVLSREVGYAANIEKATTERAKLNFAPVSDLKSVATPNKKTIDEVCTFLNIPQYQSIKCLVYTAIYGLKEANYLIMLLGDDELNELKLKNLLNADHIRPATSDVLHKLGLVAGFIGPISDLGTTRVLVDQAISMDHSFVVGANKADEHLSGFCVKRDLKKYETVDLRLSKTDDVVKGTNAKVEIVGGIEVGHIFQLGDNYTKSMKATVLDQNGKAQFPLMGCYGIGVTRTMQAAIEQNHDEFGIKWPMAIAPFHVHLVEIGKSDEFKAQAVKIYSELKAQGIEVLFDDRNQGPGFKLKDAELLGLPIIVTLGERDLQATGEVDLKIRKTMQSEKIKLNDLIPRIKQIMSEQLK
jgi:prolyl-tRNA synthetase